MVTLEADRILTGIGARIEEHRTARGLTQVQLAKLCGVSQGAINKAEAGQAVTVVTLVKVAEVLDITLDDLVPV